MRELTSHKVTGVNDGLTVLVLDEPGHGGACHQYAVEHAGGKCPGWKQRIGFQNGTLPEVGVNGLTPEVLLSILIDRLEGFQSGPFACPENEAALNSLKGAQSVLKSRTEQRTARGVEGTHQP